MQRVTAFLTIMASAAALATPVWAQAGVSIGADALFYGDNTEFRNPFREGETLFGAAARVDARVAISPTVSLVLGVFGNQRFGSESAFEQVRPLIALTIDTPRSSFVFGTLRTPAVRPSASSRVLGPDRTGPHGLLPPLQRETLAFERPYEAGLQWRFEGARVAQDAWLQWQRLNTPAHRERLDGGVRSAFRVAGPLSIPAQLHIVHEGGQLFASGVVRDGLAVASGLVLAFAPGDSRARPNRLALTIEALGLWSHDTPDREQPSSTRDGGAFFGRAAAERGGWRAHLIAWRGDDFVKDEGDPNYMSIRRDGRRYRGIRDYAEVGLTRAFALAPGAALETSFRLHRVERHYEYSYRVMAVAGARVRVK